MILIEKTIFLRIRENLWWVRTVTGFGLRVTILEIIGGPRGIPAKGAVLTSIGWGTRAKEGNDDLEFPEANEGNGDLELLFWPTFILISVTMSPGSNL